MESLTGVSAEGVGSGTFGITSSEESLDKLTRLFGLSRFIEWRRGGWTLHIFEGYNTRLVDAAIRAPLSPNAI